MALMEVGDKDFDQKVLKSERPVVVDFWAPWCMPCRMVGPIIEELANTYGANADFAKVNVDESPQVAVKFNIRTIPTIMIFKSGECVDKIVGACPKEYFDNKVKGIIGAKGGKKGD